MTYEPNVTAKPVVYEVNAALSDMVEPAWTRTTLNVTYTPHYSMSEVDSDAEFQGILDLIATIPHLSLGAVKRTNVNAEVTPTEPA